MNSHRFTITIAVLGVSAIFAAGCGGPQTPPGVRTGPRSPTASTRAALDDCSTVKACTMFLDGHRYPGVKFDEASSVHLYFEASHGVDCADTPVILDNDVPGPVSSIYLEMFEDIDVSVTWTIDSCDPIPCTNYTDTDQPESCL